MQLPLSVHGFCHFCTAEEANLFHCFPNSQIGIVCKNIYFC